MIKSFGHLDMAIAMDGSGRLLEAGEQGGWQWRQARLFQMEQFSHLTLGRPMNAHIGHRFLPVQQELIYLSQRGECAASHSVGLDVFDAAFDFSLVLRNPWQTGQYRRAVMTTKIDQLGIEFRIGPVGLENSRFKIVEVDGQRPTAEMAERIFQAP